VGNSVATVTGTALVPGVSMNKRLYSTELIGKAVARAQARLADPDGMPLTMRVAHPKPGEVVFAPVTEIVGRVTKIWQEADGRARFTAAIADTHEGRTVAALVDNRDGRPYLRNVSIRGSWLGRTHRTLLPGGEMAESADDLELDGLDYTHKPGVAGADIEQVAGPDEGARESGPDGRTPITESVQEALVTAINEASAPAATIGPKVWADMGYLADGDKRLPLDSRSEAKAAWRHITEADNARKYTSAQLKRVKGRIKTALGKHGVGLVGDGWLVESAEGAPVLEGYGEERPGSFYVTLDNGKVCVTVGSYCIDPHDLDRIGRAAMDGACQALAAMDPDMDGDIDVPGAPSEDTDGDMGGESAPATAAAAVVETEPAAPETGPATPEPAPTLAPNEAPAPVPAADSTTEPESEDPAMAETTTAAEGNAATPAAAPVAGITFTDDQFKQFLDRMVPAAAGAPAESAPAAAATVAEATAAAEPALVVETEDQRIQRLVAEGIAAERTRLIQETVERQGPPQRKGLVGRVQESGELATTGNGGELNSQGLPADWPDKPLHEYKGAERAKLSAALMQHVVGNRV
jgi:hypothetical protein